MGWFEEQVKKRKELDNKSFEESFMSLAGLNIKNKDNLSEEALRENYAIKQILSFYHHQMVEIPSNVTNFKDKLNYALKQYDIEYRKVELNDEYVHDTKSPILIYTFLHNIPVILFPIGEDEYYYINYSTGKKVRIKADLVNRFEIDAYVFYRPLPNTKVSIKEYIKYLRKSIRLLDIILLIVMYAVVAGVGLLLPILTRQLTGEVVESQNLNLFITTSIYVVSVAFILVALQGIQGYVNTRITVKVSKSIKEATMMRVLSLPPSFFKKYNTGELTARFGSVISLASLIINGVFMTVVSFIMSLSYLFQLVGFAPSLIAPVVIILVVSSAFSILVAITQRKYTMKSLEINSKESGATYEMINGIQKIRLSGSEKRAFANWANLYAKSTKVRYNPPLIIRLQTAISIGITLAGNVIIYYVAAINNLDAGSYMAFVSSFGILSGAFASLTSMVGVLFQIGPVYNMARPILETEPEVSTGKISLPSISGNIKLDNISFKYTDNGPLILNKLSLDIKEGEYIAIVGQTGCGKSTLVRLLLGFEQPLEGDIYYDGNNIKDVDLVSLRRNIGTVMQGGNLFHADIFSNIIISSPNLKEEDAWVAAEIANIADDIREMPMGMKTVISEGQGGISGGQKQRIMIARAIVHHPKVLIFDEATSALDNKTQKSITESIDKLNCTRIVIAHRLSTIKSADRIIMLEGGKIIEDGDYQTLIEKNGKFAELVNRQRLDKNS